MNGTSCSSSSNRAPPPPDPVLVLSGKEAVTSLVCWSDEVIVTGHHTGLIQVWNLSTRRVMSTWSGHSDSVIWLTSVVVATAEDTDKDKVLLSQGRDGLVKAWAWVNKQQGQGSNLWTLIDQVPSAPLIFCNSAVVIDSTSSSRFIATPAEETSHVNVYKILTKTPTPTPSHEGKEQTCFSLSKSPVCILKPENSKLYGMCMRMCPTSNYTQNSSCESPKGYDTTSIANQKATLSESCLLVGYESGVIAFWNVLKEEMIQSHKVHDDSVMGLACWSDPISGQIKGISASVSNVIQCWNISDSGTFNDDKSVHVTNEGFNDIAIRKDGRIFVTGGWDGRGRVFGVKKLRALAVLTYHKESINCVAFSPNNELVLASKDGYITFWGVFKGN